MPTQPLVPCRACRLPTPADLPACLRCRRPLAAAPMDKADSGRFGRVSFDPPDPAVDDTNCQETACQDTAAAPTRAE